MLAVPLPQRPPIFPQTEGDGLPAVRDIYGEVLWHLDKRDISALHRTSKMMMSDPQLVELHEQSRRKLGSVESIAFIWFEQKLCVLERFHYSIFKKYRTRANPFFPLLKYYSRELQSKFCDSHLSENECERLANAYRDFLLAQRGRIEDKHGGLKLKEKHLVKRYERPNQWLAQFGFSETYDGVGGYK